MHQVKMAKDAAFPVKPVWLEPSTCTPSGLAAGKLSGSNIGEESEIG